MKSIITVLVLFVFIPGFLIGQIYPDKYFIAFTDKDNSPYSISNPSEYLSQRAIDRRVRQGISVDIKDLPVNPAYIQGVKEVGVTILNPTKWLNGVTIQTDDPSKIAVIQALPYVKGVKKSFVNPVDPKFESDFFRFESFNLNPKIENWNSGRSSFDYGPSYNQIHMLNGDLLHDMGYRGEGFIIAVLDGGFLNADDIPAFDSLWMNNQIIATRDFVKGGEVTFDTHPHGTMVLSTMGANVPGTLIGTAPKANYLLLRSEDTDSEYIIEEYNWVSAAEFADSLGADIINSSLGYTTFLDPDQDHTYEDMDGNTAPVTVGADVAASRGMIVVNSAGNSGSSPWFYIGAPADGDSVFAVGAVFADGSYVYFSSRGPSYDGRIKPNIAAQGYDTYAADPGGSYGGASGTSFSSPVMAGMVACLWQTHPNLKNMELLAAIEASGTQANNPDDYLGYGIPDFYEANNLLTVIDSRITMDDPEVSVYPNPFSDQFSIVAGKDLGNVTVHILDISGRQVYTSLISLREGQVSTINNLDGLSSGVYSLRITHSGKAVYRKIVRL